MGIQYSDERLRSTGTGIAPAHSFQKAPLMNLADLYVQARRLTPRAARFAEKLLRGSPQIQYEVRHAMLVALLDLARVAQAPTVTEWSALERPAKSKDARTHADVVEARLFLEACAAFGAEHFTN